MNRTIGQEAKDLRLKAGYTLRAFAKELKISAAHLSDIEHGRRLPSELLLRKMTDLLARVGATWERFKELDTRLDPETRDWVGSHPGAQQILRVSKESGKSVKEILQMLEKSLKDSKKKKDAGEDQKG